MVLVEQSAMESNQSLPLLVGQLLSRLCLLLTYLDTLLLHHDQTRVDAFDLVDQLLLGYRPRLGLLEEGSVPTRIVQVTIGVRCRGRVDIVLLETCSVEVGRRLQMLRGWLGG
jgi:hypothetical protein